jgi:hypothetical protein
MNESRDELRALLGHATIEDLERIVTALDRWPRPTGLAVSLMIARQRPESRQEVEDGIVMELERAASAPLERTARRVLRKPARDEIHEAVTETARRLDVRVRVPVGGTLTSRLRALTTSVVDRAIASLPPDGQRRLLGDALDRSDPKTSMPDLARAAAIPVLGAPIVEGIVVHAAAAFLGREVARGLLRAAIARAPFLPAVLGPLAWTGGGALLAWELAKPAYRKLVPALLFVGLLTLRKPSEAHSPDRS